MTMPSDYVPKHCHHKAKGLGFVRLDKRQCYTGRWGTDEANAEYDRLLADWLANGRQLRDDAVDRSAYLVRDLVADYVVAFDATHQGSSEPQRLRYTVKPLLRMWGTRPACKFRPRDLKALRRHLVERNLSLTTINTRITMLKAMFRWGVEEEHVHPDVANGLRAVRNLRRGAAGAKPPKIVRPAHDDDVEAVLPHVSPQIAAMIQIQRLAGTRPGEVTIMRGADLDRSAVPWLYKPTKHKNDWRDGEKHERIIPLGPRARDILQPFLDSRLPAAFLFTPEEADENNRARKGQQRKSKEPPSQAKRRQAAQGNPKAVFSDHYDVHAYRRAVVRGCKNAGVPQWTPHRLRHAAATAMLTGARNRWLASSPWPQGAEGDGHLRGAGCGRGKPHHGRDGLVTVQGVWGQFRESCADGHGRGGTSSTRSFVSELRGVERPA